MPRAPQLQCQWWWILKSLLQKVKVRKKVAVWAEDLGRSRHKKGRSTRNKVKVWAEVAVGPFLEDPSRSRHKNGSSTRKKLWAEVAQQPQDWQKKQYVEPSSFRLRALRSTDWARQTWDKRYALQIVEQRGHICISKQQLPRTEHGKTQKEQRERERELTQVQRLCVVRLLKRWPQKQIWSQVTGPLFGGSKPLTAQKGIQAAGKGSGAIAPLFGRSRPLTAQKGVQHQEKGEGLSWGSRPLTADKRGPAVGKKVTVCAEVAASPFWRIQAAHGTKRGPAVGEEKQISKRSNPVSHRAKAELKLGALHSTDWARRALYKG